jgi:DNA-binding MarR family transcriptional regulator
MTSSSGAPDDPPLGELLMGVARGLRGRFVALLDPWQLSPHQARALRAVGRGQGMRLADLAGALRIAPRSATEVVDALAERGLVERTADPSDRRAVLVRLTGAGRATLADVDAARAADASDVFACLDAGERAELARLLRRLADGVGAGGDHGGPRRRPADAASDRSAR